MKKFLDLGYQPLANSYLSKRNIKKSEKKFKLSIGFDPKSFLVSILNTVPKEKMFNKNYPYKSSESLTMRNQFRLLSSKIKKNFNPKLILEIGSNDGAFISNFDKNNVIGVEPCKNLANLTKKKGFKIFSNYWNTTLAKKITKNNKIDLIYSANTLSHIEDFDEIFNAIDIALSKNGILILEDPSLLECIKNGAYDQFYCEHLYVFSTMALEKILSKFKLKIFFVENIKTHGGSNRYYIKRNNNLMYKIDLSVKQNIAKEKNFGLHKLSTYKNFAKKVAESKKGLRKIFNDLAKKNKIIIGYGATAKSCTVLNYCKIHLNLLNFSTIQPVIRLENIYQAVKLK